MFKSLLKTVTKLATVLGALSKQRCAVDYVLIANQFECYSQLKELI